jgi:hypothetical protein
MRLRHIGMCLVAVALLASLLGIIGSTGSAGAAGSSHKAASSHQRADPIPNCPAAAAQCRIDITVRQSVYPVSVCDSFESTDGACVGSSVGTPQWIEPNYSPKLGLQTLFAWKSSGLTRFVDLQVYSSPLILTARIIGRVPTPASAEFDVTDASNRHSSDHWHTGSAAPPGSPGGPLYIDYEHKFGSKIHIYGVLERN